MAVKLSEGLESLLYPRKLLRITGVTFSIFLVAGISCEWHILKRGGRMSSTRIEKDKKCILLYSQWAWIKDGMHVLAAKTSENP